jgi:voltage-gated potassium channel
MGNIVDEGRPISTLEPILPKLIREWFLHWLDVAVRRNDFIPAGRPSRCMATDIAHREIHREQHRVLRSVEDWLEGPMFVLSLVWAALLVVELTRGLSPALETLSIVLWLLFLVEFAFRFTLAPRKVKFLRRNWLTVLALALPALRVFRVARVAQLWRFGRTLRGITFARLVTAFNRGLRSMRQALGRYAIGYVLVLTLLVTMLGSAGMYAFERPEAGGGLRTFGDALWFTAMLITTSGSDYWPRTAEGRILCFLLAVYAFAIFGYVTATVAAVLLGRQDLRPGSAADNQGTLETLREEIVAIKEKLRRIA